MILNTPPVSLMISSHPISPTSTQDIAAPSTGATPVNPDASTPNVANARRVNTCAQTSTAQRTCFDHSVEFLPCFSLSVWGMDDNLIDLVVPEFVTIPDPEPGMYVKSILAMHYQNDTLYIFALMDSFETDEYGEDQIVFEDRAYMLKYNVTTGFYGGILTINECENIRSYHNLPVGHRPWKDRHRLYITGSVDEYDVLLHGADYPVSHPQSWLIDHTTLNPMDESVFYDRARLKNNNKIWLPKEEHTFKRENLCQDNSDVSAPPALRDYGYLPTVYNLDKSNPVQESDDAFPRFLTDFPYYEGDPEKTDLVSHITGWSNPVYPNQPENESELWFERHTFIEDGIHINLGVGETWKSPSLIVMFFDHNYQCVQGLKRFNLGDCADPCYYNIEAPTARALSMYASPETVIYSHNTVVSYLDNNIVYMRKAHAERTDPFVNSFKDGTNEIDAGFDIKCMTVADSYAIVTDGGTRVYNFQFV